MYRMVHGTEQNLTRYGTLFGIIFPRRRNERQEICNQYVRTQTLTPLTSHRVRANHNHAYRPQTSALRNKYVSLNINNFCLISIFSVDSASSSSSSSSLSPQYVNQVSENEMNLRPNPAPNAILRYTE